jgi:glycosyltransferase involved in cell wall biosynthesis
MTLYETSKIVVAIPCFNEAATIEKVVRDFRSVLQNAEICVFDNNSTDGSADLARSAGAEVIRVPQQGKGHVMRVIFDTVVADALIVIDGDDTYFAADAPALLEPILRAEADMMVGDRLQASTDHAMRRSHQWGNRLIVASINRMFGTSFRDILSGYRVFSRRFVKEVPLLMSGFETETEMTLQALEEGLVVVEVPIQYQSRPEGSHSKLNSWRDGYRIMLTAIILLRDHHPLRLFGIFAVVSWLIAFIAFGLRLINYSGWQLFPDALLSGLVILFAPLGVIVFGFGLVLNAINTRFRELRQIMQRNNNK